MRKAAEAIHPVSPEGLSGPHGRQPSAPLPGAPGRGSWGAMGTEQGVSRGVTHLPPLRLPAPLPGPVQGGWGHGPSKA